MNPSDITWSTYIDFDKENNKEDPIYKADDNVRILKYIFVFAKGYVLNCSEEVFGIKEIKRNCWNVLPKRIEKNKSKRVQSWKSNQKKIR